MPPRSDSEFLQNDSLARSIKKIQSFSDLEEDEELRSVAPRVIELAIAVVEAIFEETKLLPYFIVPTQSAGVGIEYRVDGVEVCYHIDMNGAIHFSAIKKCKVLEQAYYGLQHTGKISLDQYNHEIEEAEARIERGEFVLHEDAINRIKGWREKGSDPG